MTKERQDKSPESVETLQTYDLTNSNDINKLWELMNVYVDSSRDYSDSPVYTDTYEFTVGLTDGDGIEKSIIIKATRDREGRMMFLYKDVDVDKNDRMKQLSLEGSISLDTGLVDKAKEIEKLKAELKAKIGEIGNEAQRKIEVARGKTAAQIKKITK
jgi:hypothetical protein